MQEKQAAAPYSARVVKTIARMVPTMNLASKISLPFMIILAIFFVKMQSNYFSLVEGRQTLQRDLQAYSADIQQVSALKNNLAEIRSDLYRVSVWSIAGVSQSRREESAEQIRTALQSTDSIISSFELTHFSGIGEVRLLFDDYSAHVKDALSIMYRNAFAGATATRPLDALYTQLIRATEAFSAHARKVISEQTKFADAQMEATAKQFILISLGSLLVVIILSLIVHLYVTRPIRKLVECIGLLERDAERVTVPYCDRSDEIGHIARALESFSAALRARRKLEKQVYEQKEEALKLASAAEAASAAKSSFLANMSHEIRTPMNSILGMAELLRETRLTKKQHFFAKTIFNSSAALLKIINDILDFSKIEAGKLQLDPIPFSPVRAIRDVVDLLGPSAQEKYLEVTVDCDPDTPASVIGDAGRIRQVLTNLIGNAVKFTEKGFVRVGLKTTYSRDRAILRFEISDSGIGIETNKLARIFDDFTQAENSTTRNYGGTGLGLSISHSLIEAMEGRIGVISQANEGSTFWFELELPVTGEIDRTAEVAASGTASENAPSCLDSSANETSCKILIADDNQLNRLLLQNMLDKERYELQYAENGEVAADMACNMAYDVILMDISMPVLDGMGATRLIRDHETKNNLNPVPIIALTAHIMPYDQKKYSDAGINDFLGKPLRKADLLRTIEKCIRSDGLSSRVIA